MESYGHSGSFRMNEPLERLHSDPRKRSRIMIVPVSVFALAIGIGGAAAPGEDLCCQVEMARAEALHEAGQFRAARRAYLRIARTQAAAGEFSGDALWNAAAVSHHLRHRRRAAQELDAAARIAAEFGRTNLEVRATLEAVFAYNELGRSDLALARAERVQTLVAAPEVSSETRDLVERRIPRS
jgi:tetratricopeptide (TPR) repeat protein